MQATLIADGEAASQAAPSEKLQQLAGEDHGSHSLEEAAAKVPPSMLNVLEGPDVNPDWLTTYDSEVYHSGFQDGLEFARCLDMIEDVREFHEACGTDDPDEPTWPNWTKRRLRADLLQEEANELIAELTHPEFSWENFGTHLADTAKEIVDVIYVAIGTALSMGIPLEKVWAEVHTSNMAKVDPVTGKVRRREDGKILKPDGWEKPDVKKVMFPQ